ncbi:MlaD family protein [Pseudonocardia alni]|uniref:MlaD family protein n=1 Tax=Pseudonocardia alni TaxID=33907 RepID=UPI0033FC40ED
MAPSRQLRRITRSSTFAFVCGLGVLGVIVIALVFASTADSGSPLADRTTVKAAFTEIGSLREGDDVRIASARVGRVERVEPGEGEALVTMSLDDARPVYANAVVAQSGTDVVARSALGQKFVDLDPGTPDAGELADDAVVPQQVTRGAQELGDLFQVFDEPTRAGLRTTLQETGGGLVGRQQDLHDLLRTGPQTLNGLGTVSRTLSENNGADLTALLQSAETLAGRFEGRQEEIADMLRSLQPTLDSLAVDRTQPLRDTLEVAPASLRDVRSALDSLNGPLADTESAMTRLRPGGEALGAATPDLRGVLREAVQPLDKVPGVSDQAQPAFSELRETADDLRPFTPRVAQTLNYAGNTLQTLAPYSSEISGFFTNITSALSNSDGAGHWLRIMPILGSESVTGAGPPVLEDPTSYRNPYPEPGQAPNDRRPLPITGERN